MIVLLALLGCAACADPEPVDSAQGTPGTVPCDLCSALCYETYTVATEDAHVSGDVVYADEPPTSGNHSACWAEWGVHAEQVAAENWVHNLEHGGVVFLYDCPSDSCPEEKAEFVSYVESLPAGTALLSPYEPAELPFTVVSWEHELELGCFDLAAIQAFYTAHVGRAPEQSTSGPGASCM
ncbi:hypothetical protein LBMAG42_07640 [Deltaproteobacteria bacterium]|nr:hypothetical protein LBMAG42_07640 [Deltaproteobacteria bacterium]